jgi:hypothetical protein
MATSRKVFIETVSLPAITATSLASLMQNSVQHWFLESDLITPSLDSAIGDEVTITPQAAIYAGNDANVRDVNNSPQYQGVPIAANEKFPLQDFAKYGLIDPNQIYFYSQNGCNVAVVFHGR